MKKLLSEMSKQEYCKALNSGMFWVWYPQATGNYCVDVLGEQPSTRFINYGTNSTEFIEEDSKFNNDVVKQPNHYQLLPEYEVKDINKALLDKIEGSDFEMTLYQAGWFQQSMQYFLRFYAKNGLEDLEKGVETMQFVVDDMKKQD